MTWRHQDRVWKLGAAASLPHKLRLYLLACANHATKDGRFWPSVRTLTRETGLDRRIIWKLTRAMLTIGWIRRIEARVGRGKTHVYRLYLPVELPAETILAVQKEVQNCTIKESESGTKRARKVVQNVSLASLEPKNLTVRQQRLPPSAAATPRSFEQILAGSPPPGLS